jgi:hypothetical protein
MHQDATMRLFDPDVIPAKIAPWEQRARSVWFRPGECLQQRLRNGSEEPLRRFPSEARLLGFAPSRL